MFFLLTVVSITCSFEFEWKEWTGAQQLVGMFKNPDPPGAKEKEVREVQWPVMVKPPIQRRRQHRVQ